MTEPTDIPTYVADRVEELILMRHGEAPEPTRLMHVTAEAWPLAADHSGIWLLTRDWPLMTEPLAADSDVYGDLELELIRAQMFADKKVLHQTSSRRDRDAFVATHVAVIGCDQPVRLRWPDALPVSPKVAAYVGKPPTHGAAELPTVRQWDVVTHALKDIALRGLFGGVGHLRFLMSPLGDAEIASKLDDNWKRHLLEWEPVLYQMYDRTHEAESA